MQRSPFGKYIRDKRVLAELTLKEVANALGITSVYLGEIERGIKPPLQREKYWHILINIIPNIILEELEYAAEKSLPVKITLEDKSKEYRDLIVTFSQRVKNEDLSRPELQKLKELLKGD